MMKRLVFSVCLLVSGVVFVGNASAYYAYYTKIDTGEPWEALSRTAQHADLVVQLAHGKLVFHRSSSYLPYWETSTGQWYLDEIVPRRGDGSEKRPDKNNIYSFVRLIESTEDSIVVHWRYFNDFELGHHAQPIGGNVGFDGVVHEYFFISPDGVVRREIRKGTKKLDDWRDPKNRIQQTVQLTPDGIEEKGRTEAVLSKAPAEPLEGAPMRPPARLEVEPVAIWHFDEGLESRSYESKDSTTESETGASCPIAGPKTVWKKGVSGTALGFDGYNSSVKSSVVDVSEYDVGFTMEAWVAPGAYSICEWTAIAHQSEWEADVRELLFQENEWGEMQLGEKLKKGFFLGIDEFGHPVAIFAIRGQIVKVQSFEPLPLYEWSHVAVTYVGEGILYLYVNGEIANFKNFSGFIEPADVDFVIGKNDESIGYVSRHVVRTYSTFPSALGFEGLIDEVKLYPEPLSHRGMRRAYKAFKPSNPRADMQPRTLPGEVGPSETFGARYAHLTYHDLWDNMWREPEHPDVVVKFDLMPTSVVFWRGCRSPGWVTETNKWISDQSTELTDWHWDDKPAGVQSCSEHMSDYQGRHSHVRIIENTDARVVVHWRYASVDVLYKHPNVCRDEDGWGVWTDEYLTIYPDGVGVRAVDQHGDVDYYFGPEGAAIAFHDTQFLSEAGTRPEDNINPQSLTVVTHEDEVHELDWSEEHPSAGLDAQVIWVNLKSDYKVFEVFPPGNSVNVWAGDEKTSYSRYSAWNHYPVTQAPCDGRFCVAPDRLTHSALGAAANLVETGCVLLYGFTNDSAERLIPLARSWNHPPDLSKTQRCISRGYDKAQRAYVIDARGDEISFSVEASEKSPLVNPCFVIQGWDGHAAVTIDGKTVTSDKIARQGLVRDADGQLRLVVWIMMETQTPTEFSFSKM
jgi:hypothetical protein